MALNTDTLKSSIQSGLFKLFSDRANKATSGDEDESPEEVVKKLSEDMADVISKAVAAYIATGEVVVGPNNIVVVSSAPGTTAAVTPLNPAKIV